MRAATLRCVHCREGGGSEVGGEEKCRSAQSPPLFSWVWGGHRGQLLAVSCCFGGHRGVEQVHSLPFVVVKMVNIH